MKNLMLFLATSLLVSWASAAEVQCKLTEYAEGQTSVQNLTLLPTEEAHGSVQFFTLSQISEVSGFVAFSKGFIVINLVHEPSGIVTSSQNDMSGMGVAHAQIILPDPSLTPRAVEVHCKMAE